MAVYFYVKSGFGTRTTGGGITKQTGSMATLGAASVYDSLDDVFADSAPPVVGDFVFCSDLHAKSYSASSTWVLTDSIDTELLVASVDDTNIDQYKAGASESWTGTGPDLLTLGSFTFWGISFDPGDDWFISTTDQVKFIDGTYTFNNANNQILIQNQGCTLEFINSNIVYNATSATTGVLITEGKFLMRGGAVQTGSATPSVFIMGSNTGSIEIDCIGVDLSAVTTYWLADFGGNINDRTANIRFDKCDKHASAAFVEEQFGVIGQKLLATNCSDSSTAAEHQIFQRTTAGDVEDDTATYRDQSQAFDGGSKTSFKVVTRANATVSRPLSFELPTQFIELSQAASDTLEIYLTSDTALTDSDIWVELIYPDGTNKNVFNWLSTVNADPLSAGTTLTTDSTSTWTAGKTNKYVISVDTTGDAGADGVPVVRINVGIASTTVYFDSEVGLA